ncbi:MAG: MFS transporter, partial [Spirochaetales bacterium]|nr:MFS transporter [Spirochaetales bacterium]
SVVKNQQEAGGRLGYVVVFIIVGSVLALAILTSLGMSGSQGKLERKKFFVRRKFLRYYGLEIFYGARKQVFLTFAPYLLILRYGADPAYLASLLGACALINIVFTPFIGRVIDKLGYRTVMIGDTCILFFVCLAYGFAHRFFAPETAFVVVSVVFILDWMISNASMASSVYVGRISENKEEMAATLSTGISINHVISVLIALGGGYIWQSLGVELLFVVAALMAVGNTLFALTIPKLEPSPS